MYRVGVLRNTLTGSDRGDRLSRARRAAARAPMDMHHWATPSYGGRLHSQHSPSVSLPCDCSLPLPLCLACECLSLAHDLPPEPYEELLAQRLRKDVCLLLRGRHPLQAHVSARDRLRDELILYVDVLRALALHSVLAHSD